MKNRRYLILAIVIVFLSAGILYTRDRQKIYGNDEASIRLLIERELGLVEGIDVFGIVDVAEFRLAGYSVNGIQFNYAEFRKNRKGDYEPVSLGETTGKNPSQIYMAYHSLVKEDGTGYTMYLIILNNNPELREIRFSGLPGQNPTVPVIAVETSPSIHVEAFPTSSRHGYEFYDAEGNPLRN